MFERLWDEDLEIQRIKAEAEARGEAKGEAKVLEIPRELVVLVVSTRFPDLVPLVREKVGNIRQLDLLLILARQIATAPDEITARWVIGTFAAQDTQ